MPAKILLVDNDSDLSSQLTDFLEKNDYEVIHSGINDALENLDKKLPDMILLNIYGIEKEALDFCRKIKTDRFNFLLPVIVYTKSNDLGQKRDFLNTDVDDLIVSPFELSELLMRIQSVIRRVRQTKDSNPLTGLPGNVSITEEIKRRIANDEKFAVCYVDLDNFKAYNDRYGYEKGDEVIKFLAKTINEVLKTKENKKDFLGHIGGDDFIVITDISSTDISIMETISNEIISGFEKNIINFYNNEDKEKGYITVKNRRGQVQLLPIMSISIGIAHNTKRNLYNAVQVSEIVAELKEYAKTKKGSNVAIDRRAD